MEKPLEELSASKLRNLLIEEVKAFVHCLDSAASHVLEEKRTRLILIFRLIGEKEKIESAPLVWGKNSAK
jgi:hypothetical protein